MKPFHQLNHFERSGEEYVQIYTDQHLSFFNQPNGPEQWYEG